MVEKSWAFGTKVHDDIEDRTSCAAHQFRLRRGRKLEMHAAHGALYAIESDVGLSDEGLQAMRLELMLAKTPCEESSGIFATLDIDYECTLQLGLSKDHEKSSP